MKMSRELIGVLVLVCLFIVLTFVFAGGSIQESSRLPADDIPPAAVVDSSYNNTRSSGSLGAFSLAHRLGYRPIAWRHSWTNLGNSGSSTLLIINPSFDGRLNPLSGMSSASDTPATYLTGSDWPTLQSWLKQGNNAILLTSNLAKSQAQQTSGVSTFGDAAGITVNTAIAPGKRNFSPSLPGPYTSGVMSVFSDSDARVVQDVPDGPALFADRSGALALSKPVGAGHLIVISDAMLFSNGELARSDNGVLFADLLAQASKSGGTILFDEFHHGDSVEDSGASMWSVLGKPIQLALMQGSVAIIVLIFILAMRFGKPISLTQGQTRHTGEYVASLASLYRRAGATTIALETIYRNFLRDLCSRLGISADTRLDILARTAAKRTNVSESSLRNLLAICEQRLDEGKLHEDELIELVRQMEQIRKDVGIA